MMGPGGPDNHVPGRLTPFGPQHGIPGAMPGYGGPGVAGFGAFPGQPRDPEMFELGQKENQLEMKVRQLLDQFRVVEGDRKEEIKGELRETVFQQFEVRQQRRRLELKRLEEELKHMQEVIERRDKARDQIIDRHISELIGVPDEMRF
ncbi:MAG: hypothetical protein JXB10_02675 [Pirellulales bacterium]|nr:hypothetical protein [Pirellulales bacterium]